MASTETIEIVRNSLNIPTLISLPTTAYLRKKRLLDLICASLLFCSSILIWPLIILLIKIDSPGPAIIKQRRMGYKGSIFTLYKFRTMYHNVELYQHAPLVKKDNRVTKIGKWLRKTSLDELPQIFNIFRGEMSFVGPRPEMEHIVKTYESWQHARFAVKPGLTGLWQISGRKDRPLTENIDLDIYYIQQHSIKKDLEIILKTIPAVIFQRGAY